MGANASGVIERDIDINWDKVTEAAERAKKLKKEVEGKANRINKLMQKAKRRR